MTRRRAKGGASVPDAAAPARKPVASSVRFEVLKRDKFACQYCGATAPDVLLHVDHIHPVAKGGDNDLLNLITSCSGCNLGKSDKLLSDDSAVEKQRRQLEELQARREQLDLLMQWKMGLVDEADDAAKRVAAYWPRVCPGWRVDTPSGLVAVRDLVRKYGAAEVIEAMDAAASQYLRYKDEKPTPESARVAWDYVSRIARMKRVHEKNPHLKDLFYIRAIIRNRLTYCNDIAALELLKEAYAAGANIDGMKDMARAARNWTDWRSDMADLANDLLKGGE